MAIHQQNESCIPHGMPTDLTRGRYHLLDFMRGRYSTLLDEIRSTGALPDGVKDAVESFKTEFTPTAFGGLRGGFLTEKDR